MKKNSGKKEGGNRLRHRAEARLLEHPVKAKRKNSDPLLLLQELQIQQIELEMQNEELKRTKAEVDLSLEKYTDLYDFAPAGYFSLNEQGAILEANLTGTLLVGMDRARLIGRRFQLFVAPPGRSAFNTFLKRAFSTRIKQSGEFDLLKEGGQPLVVNLEAHRLPAGGECRVVLLDITERKQIDNELKASLQENINLKAALNEHSIVAITDVQGRITFANEKFCAVSKYSREELMGKDHRLINSGFHPREFFHKLWADIHRGVAWHGEIKNKAKDGTFYWVDTTIFPILDEEGEPCQFLAIRDVITARKEAEEKVLISETRFRRLFEASQDGVLLLDPDTRKITDANPFMTKLLGYSHDELVGKELFEIGLLSDESASQKMFRKLKLKHQVRYEDLPLQSETGRHQDVEVVANLYTENGQSVIQCNIRDITKRKQVEGILRRKEALISALLEQAPIGVYVLDADFRLIQINPRALPLFSKIQPILGRDFSEVIHLLWPKRVADQAEKHFRHTLLTGAPYQSPEFVERRLDTGVQEAYEWQLQRITLPSGDHRLVCFFSDITERKQSEETRRRLEVLAASNAKLIAEIIRRQAVEKALTQSEQQARLLLEQSRELQKKLRQLTHQNLLALENQRKAISHELHDKISQILIGINVRLAVFIRESGIKAQAVAPLRRLVEQSVRTVHQFSSDLRPAMLDDLGLIPALRAYIKDFPDRKGRKIQFSASSGVEALDGVKQTMLYRVAQEALVNVAKHAQATVVKVAIAKVRDGISLTISDNGKGFQVGRIASAQWENRHGLIGMRERVEMGGGQLSVESAAGDGTTIRVVLPAGKPRKAQ